jgi:hypothetical protein
MLLLVYLVSALISAFVFFFISAFVFFFVFFARPQSSTPAML